MAEKWRELTTCTPHVTWVSPTGADTAESPSAVTHLDIDSGRVAEENGHPFLVARQTVVCVEVKVKVCTSTGESEGETKLEIATLS